MRRILSLLIVIISLSIIVIDLVSTTIAANARARALETELSQIPPPSSVALRKIEAQAATRRAIATAGFEGRVSTAELLAHYRRALEAGGWSACGTRRSGYVYTGEVITHYVYCKDRTTSATLSIERANDTQVTLYGLAFEWNTRWWWIPVLGLGLTLTAIIGLQVAFRRQPVRESWSVIFRTELRPEDCRQRLESLAGHNIDGLALRRYETNDSIVYFEIERRRRRWDLNVLGAYFYGSLTPEDDGTRIAGRFGLAPAAKSTGAVICTLFLMGVALQARDAPAAAVLNAGIIIAVAALVTLVARRFWSGDRSLVERLLERLLAARRAA